LETLRRYRSSNGTDGNIGWQGQGSFFGQATNLLDVILQAVVVEAWVVKEGAGGFRTFPTHADIEKWVHQPPQVLDDMQPSAYESHMESE
jgi:hypothetical protein